MSNEIASIHKPLMLWLKAHNLPYHRQRSDKRSTCANGDPDFIITKGGRVLYIEAKAIGGKLSPDQQKRIAELRQAGNPVVVAYSLEAAVEAVEEWRK